MDGCRRAREMRNPRRRAHIDRCMDCDKELTLRIAVIGGTGAEGSGLAYRWGAAGHQVVIGSRSAEKGAAAAAELRAALPSASFDGADNLSAAQQAEVIVLAVPYEAQTATLAAILDAVEGKLFITVVAPLRAPKGRVWRLPSNLSAAEEAQQQIGPRARVVAAFQNISAAHLRDLEHELACDVLVCGDDSGDKAAVMQLCADAGLRGVNAGALQNASAVEGLTAVLYAINVIHKIKDAGLRITGLPAA